MCFFTFVFCDGDELSSCGYKKNAEFLRFSSFLIIEIQKTFYYITAMHNKYIERQTLYKKNSWLYTNVHFIYKSYFSLHNMSKMNVDFWPFMVETLILGLLQEKYKEQDKQGNVNV